MLDRIAERSHSGGLIGALARVLLRFLQFVLALTVAGLYGVDLHKASKAHVGSDGKWVFAEVVAGLAAVTCIVYAVPFLKSYWFWAWDCVLL